MTHPADPDQMDDRLRRQAERLQALLGRLVRPPEEQVLSEVELSHREVRLLMALGEKGEAIMSNLASVLNAPQSTVTRMVDRLAMKGLVEHLRSEQDRRIVVVRATTKAKSLGEAFHRHRFEISRRMLEPLSPGEREILLELMHKLAHSRTEGQV